LKRRRGRPPLDPDGVCADVHLRLTTRLFDELCKTAHVARCSVPDVVRAAIARYVRVDTPGEKP